MNVNPVSTILISSGNQSILSAGQRPTALLAGQLGVFNKRTGLSVDGSSGADAFQDFFVALGVSAVNAAGGAIDDLRRSAGQYIKLGALKSVNFRCYSAAQPKVIDITGFSVKCDTDYGIRFNVRAKEVANLYGFNFPAKTFIVRSSCCADGCSGCGDGDGNKLVYDLVNGINNDAEAKFVAQMIDYTTTAGIPAVVTDYVTWAASNVGKTLGIRVQVSSEQFQSWSTVNQKYFNPRLFDIDANLIEGFDCNSTVALAKNIRIVKQGSGYTSQTYTGEALTGGTGSGKQATIIVTSGKVTSVTVTTAGTGYVDGDLLGATLAGGGSGFQCVFDSQRTIYSQNYGYDIAQTEYDCAGNSDYGKGPFRASDATGLAIDNYNALAVKTEKYVTLDLGYTNPSNNGGVAITDMTNLRTTIAIPCADTTTRTGLIALLNTMFTGKFDSLVGDNTACQTCTSTYSVPNLVTDLNDADSDGIGG